MSQFYFFVHSFVFVRSIIIEVHLLMNRHIIILGVLRIYAPTQDESLSRPVPDAGIYKASPPPPQSSLTVYMYIFAMWCTFLQIRIANGVRARTHRGVLDDEYRTNEMQFEFLLIALTLASHHFSKCISHCVCMRLAGFSSFTFSWISPSLSLCHSLWVSVWLAHTLFRHLTCFWGYRHQRTSPHTHTHTQIFPNHPQLCHWGSY